jgi:hypothetical protein
MPARTGSQTANMRDIFQNYYGRFEGSGYFRRYEDLDIKTRLPLTTADLSGIPTANECIAYVKDVFFDTVFRVSPGGFKIGITENVIKRWEQWRDRGMDRMWLVFIGDDSGFSSMVEKALIDYCKYEYNGPRSWLVRNHLLLNKAPGGESASDGSPHYCYIVRKKV